jgi:hypothetical protein
MSRLIISRSWWADQIHTGGRSDSRLRRTIVSSAHLACRRHGLYKYAYFPETVGWRCRLSTLRVRTRLTKSRDIVQQETVVTCLLRSRCLGVTSPADCLEVARLHQAGRFRNYNTLPILSSTACVSWLHGPCMPTGLIVMFVAMSGAKVGRMGVVVAVTFAERWDTNS